MAATVFAPQEVPLMTALPVHSYPSDAKRRKLRIAIVTENFLPKVDGVTRTLARLLEHLNLEGHEAMVLGPETGMTKYAGHPVVGTFGVPLIIYPGLKLNFMRPRFVRRLQQFKPDVIHFVDPIWLGAQMLPVVQKWLPEVPCVSSYHTNLPTYATLFGMPWLERTMWRLTRNLHDRCEVVFCPSDSTRRMLESKGFTKVAIWSRGVDPEIFTPNARDDNLRASWGCYPKPAALNAQLATPGIHAADLTARDRAALELIAGKMGMSPASLIRRARGGAERKGSQSSEVDDESYIRTPMSVPMIANNSTSFPGFSPPPPAYEDLHLPALPSGGFALPPPAMAMPEPNARSSASALPVSADTAESKTVVLYVGRISWEKNLRLLIEAFRLLPSSVRASAKLVFVGDGPARADLTRLCAKYGLDASFMGHQKGKRLAAMYASASIFAFPSFTETFGQVVLEALASGLPVVGLHAEGTSDLVTHGRNGLLLDVVAATTKAASSSAAVSAAAAGRAASASSPSSSTSASDFASAASNAIASLPSSPAVGSSSGASRKLSSDVASTFAPTSGLPTPIPGVVDFANAMSPNSAAFSACARRYSMLLERLVRDRTLRATMGQRALAGASTRTWWDAMDAAVQGYERAVQSKGGKGAVSDEELEAIRTTQRSKAPLTGPIIKLCVILYLVGFLCLWLRLYH